MYQHYHVILRIIQVYYARASKKVRDAISSHGVEHVVAVPFEDVVITFCPFVAAASLVPVTTAPVSSVTGDAVEAVTTAPVSSVTGALVKTFGCDGKIAGHSEPCAAMLD
eukprot:scpid58719/ scgid12412/ 